MKPAACDFSGLQSFYDRQLGNAGSIVEELVGSNRVAMKLIAKLCPF